MRKSAVLITVILGLIFSSHITFGQPGTITTIAGTGTAGYSGDGGPASSATLNTPHGVILDAYGNTYIADATNSAIRKINAAGVISTIAGTGTAGYSGDGGPATSAQINTPFQLVLDASGNIYFCERHGNRVRKINTSGIISTIAGNGTSGSSGDGGPATAALFDSPQGIAMDTSGNIYIADFYNERVRRINPSGIISTFAGTGSAGYSGDGGAATSASLNKPNFLFFDHSGNLFISDNDNHVIRKVNPSGIISTFAGNGSAGFSGDGGPATAARLHFACGVSEDGLGNIYIADHDNNRIRMVNTSGVITTIAGTGASGYSGDGGPASAAQINRPVDVYVSNTGDLFVSDYGNSVIRKILNAPTFTSDSLRIYLYRNCSGPQLNVCTPHYVSGSNLKTYYGDGTSTTTAFSSGFGGGYCSVSHTYSNSGTYTIKQLLYYGTTVVDSFQFIYTHVLCNNFAVQIYYDANRNCTEDSSDAAMTVPLVIEVDSNGIAIDTISATSGLYYTAYGSAGDIYGFKVISVHGGLNVTCPSTAIIYDTVSSSRFVTPPKYFGLNCISTSLFDLSVYGGIRSGVHTQMGNIYSDNSYCPFTSGTVTLNHSIKYAYHNAYPTPASITATSITWNVSGLTGIDTSVNHIWYHLEVPSIPLRPGDTTYNTISIIPTRGDADSTDNIEIIIDTVKAGFDPNEISVKPAGCFESGALPIQLQYTINFENMGNDTAHNIYVMDTLSDNLDPSTMTIVLASHKMYTTKIRAGGRTILKFDFPQIKLLDSSHHGKCEGAVIYNIKTKPRLGIGANIANRAGIYFDVNDVVITNTVNNSIGCPNTGLGRTISDESNPLIYPNPASEELNIKMELGSYNSCIVSNIVGTKILDLAIVDGWTKLNIKSMPAGIYYVTLKGSMGVKVVRFVKE